jgi:hypothetical protein
MTERQMTQTVTLSDGRTLRLVGDVNALCDYERVMKAAGFDPMRELQAMDSGAGAGFSGLRALFWAFAQEHQPDLSLRDCGAILHREGALIAQAVAASMAQAMPEPDGDGESGAELGKTRPQAA